MPTFLERRLLVPAVYDVTIVDVSLLSMRWLKSEDNPDGLVYRVAADVYLDGDDDAATTIFDVIAPHNRIRMADLFEACGLTLGDDEDFRPRLHELKGLDARCAVKTYVPEAGRAAGEPKSGVSAWVV